MLFVESRIPGPQVGETACVPSGSAHARLDARDRLSARLGVPPDHPFFTALREGLRCASGFTTVSGDPFFCP
jgi:hypothetical protein